MNYYIAEAQRQRLALGLYHQTRLPAEQYHRTLFQWGYPELARYCDERSLQYPPIDDKGQLINPSDWYSRVRQQLPMTEA